MSIFKYCILLLVSLLALPVAAEVERSSASQPEPSSGFERIGKCSAKFLEGVLADGAGGLWMLDVEGGRILHADRGKDCVERAKLDGFPSGAKFAPDGTITIVGRSGIHSFDPVSGRIIPISALYQGQELTGLNDLCYDQRGGFYFTAPADSDTFKPDGRVFYRSAKGEVTLIASGVAYPDGIAVSPDGNAVAIAEFGKKRVVSVPALEAGDALKVPVVLAYTAGGYGPDGLAYAPDGRLVIGNFGGGSLEILDLRYGLTTLRLPPESGAWTNNVAITGGSIVAVEAQKGEIWKVALPGASPSVR